MALPDQVWLEGEERAEQQAIARTAKHRLERGIWTSPGAGLWTLILLWLNPSLLQVNPRACYQPADPVA